MQNFVKMQDKTLKFFTLNQELSYHEPTPTQGVIYYKPSLSVLD